MDAIFCCYFKDDTNVTAEVGRFCIIVIVNTIPQPLPSPPASPLPNINGIDETITEEEEAVAMVVKSAN